MSMPNPSASYINIFIFGLPWWLSGQNLPANPGDAGSILGQEDSPEEEMATHSCISCLENPMDRGTWGATVHGVTKSGIRLSD